MPDLPRERGSIPAEASATLTDRVLARVTAAGLAADRRASATRGRPRPGPVPPDPRAAEVTRSPAQVRETRSLRLVFGDLGRSYGRYRRRTGAAVSPDIRDAAYRFRRELNVSSLVSVAARLDELHILSW